MTRGAFLATAVVSLLLLLAAGCRNPPGMQQADQAASTICGVCRVGTSGGPAGGGGRRPPVAEEGVKVIVRGSRGKQTITEATSGKSGEYKIALAPGKYEVEAVLQKSLLCDYCRRTVEVRSGEVARVDLDLYVIQP
jgi:hypothetical protein